MRWLLSTLLLLFIQTSFAQDPFLLSEKAENFYNQYYSSVHAKYRKTIEETVFSSRGKNISADSIHHLFQSKFPTLSDLDIDALVVLVMMQASKNDIEDMKAALAALKAEQAKKKASPAKTKKNRNDSLTDEERKIADKQQQNNNKDNISEKNLFEVSLQEATERRFRSNQVMNELMNKIDPHKETIIRALKQ